MSSRIRELLDKYECLSDGEAIELGEYLEKVDRGDVPQYTFEDTEELFDMVESLGNRKGGEEYMAKFKVKFTWTMFETYEAIVEAHTEEQAINKVLDTKYGEGDISSVVEVDTYLDNVSVIDIIREDV